MVHLDTIQVGGNVKIYFVLNVMKISSLLFEIVVSNCSFFFDKLYLSNLTLHASFEWVLLLMRFTQHHHQAHAKVIRIHLFCVHVCVLYTHTRVCMYGQNHEWKNVEMYSLSFFIIFSRFSTTRNSLCMINSDEWKKKRMSDTFEQLSKKHTN